MNTKSNLPFLYIYNLLILGFRSLPILKYSPVNVLSRLSSPVFSLFFFIFTRQTLSNAAKMGLSYSESYYNNKWMVSELNYGYYYDVLCEDKQEIS